MLEWHGPEGHAFAPGELVVELETHKALVEVRAGHAGVLDHGAHAVAPVVIG